MIGSPSISTHTTPSKPAAKAALQSMRAVVMSGVYLQKHWPSSHRGEPPNVEQSPQAWPQSPQLRGSVCVSAQ